LFDLIAECIAIDALRIQPFGLGVFVEGGRVVPACSPGLFLGALLSKNIPRVEAPQPNAAVMRDDRP
jgi:hypothetical protein